MTTDTRSRPPDAPQPPARTKVAHPLGVVILVVAAVLLGGVLGWAVWGGSNEGPTTFHGGNGTVSIQGSYAAKVVFVNGNDAGCLEPIGGGKRLCTAFAEIPGTATPKLGATVNAVIMKVTDPNGYGYQMATLWPKKVNG